eukprot:m.4759 g.4759  ORF g.4759 m.4759 type:complete len:61 (-) comp2286_c0_seq1:24-206(-)
MINNPIARICGQKVTTSRRAELVVCMINSNGLLDKVRECVIGSVLKNEATCMNGGGRRRR